MEWRHWPKGSKTGPPKMTSGQRKERRRQLKDAKQEKWVATLKAKLDGLTYQQYIDSEEWWRLRQKAMRKAKKTCTCGRRACQVHHKKYPDNGQWWLDDIKNLVCLCGECHQNTHHLLPPPDVPWQWLHEKPLKKNRPR